MSQEKIEQLTEEVVNTISNARQSRKPGLAIVRCRSNREVDQARNMLGQAQANFPWKSQPIAEIDPPDLIGYVVHKGGANGPCFLAYGAPVDRNGQLVQPFVDYLNHSIQRHADKPFSLVLLLNLEEVRQVSERALTFWKQRSCFVAWPVMDTGRFVPSTMGGNIRQRGGNIQQQMGGVQAGFGMQAVFDGIQMDMSGVAAQDNGVTPWAGSPYTDEDNIPDYIAEAAPPVGRRWGRTLAPDDLEGGQLIDQCRALLDQGQTEMARTGLAKAAKRFRAVENGSATAECYVLLARASELRFDHGVALEWYEQALATYETMEEAAGISDCCAMIGYLRFGHGDMDGAYSFFDRGLQRDEEEEDKLRMSSGYRRIGVIQERRRELDQALTLYERSAKIEEENEDNFALSRSLHHQARLQQERGELDAAVALYERSMELKGELEDQIGLATGHHEFGNLYFKKGEKEAALKEYLQALEIEEQYRDFQGIAVTKAQIGLVEKELFNFADAVEAFTIASELFKRLQSPNAAAIDPALKSAAEMVDVATFKDRQRKGRDYVEQLVAGE